MNLQIWRELTQILYDRSDLAEIIKPFFENLKNENINDEKYFPFLNNFSQSHLKVLFHNEIISKEKYNSLISHKNKNQSSNLILENENKTQTLIENIISGDKNSELQKLIQEKDIKTFNTIITTFREIERMKIPIIQYCIMKKAINCFKYLLVNGFDDTNNIMEDQNPNNELWIKEHRYEWGCMATAIYFGNKEIIKILEEKGIEKGKNPDQIEAAILSYRNQIAEEIINEMNEQKEEMENFLNKAILTSSKNNIQETIFLIKKGANINNNAYNNQKNQ